MASDLIGARLVDVRALTLRQPWAHAITHHGKVTENRTWMPPEGVDRIIIHAGKGLDRTAVFPDGPCFHDANPDSVSAFVAVADIAFACDSSRLGEIVCGCGPWAMPGHCHWMLTNVRVLTVPVSASGRQGLWRPLPVDVDAIAEALPARERVAS